MEDVSNSDSSGSGDKRTDRSREKAAAVMAAQRRESRNRVLIGVAAGVFLAGLGVAGVLAASGSQTSAAESSVPAGVTGAAFRVGAPDAPVVLEVYQDFQCPVCKIYEDALGESLAALVESGQVAVDYHIMSFLGPESERAANAAACAADGGKFAEFHALLMANQPAEQTGGFTEPELVGWGESLGLGDEFALCVSDNSFGGFVESVDLAAAENNVNGTPTFVLDGERLAGASGGPLPPAEVYQRVVDATGAAGGGGE